MHIAAVSLFLFVTCFSIGIVALFYPLLRTHGLKSLFWKKLLHFQAESLTAQQPNTVNVLLFFPSIVYPLLAQIMEANQELKGHLEGWRDRYSTAIKRISAMQLTPTAGCSPPGGKNNENGSSEGNGDGDHDENANVDFGKQGGGDVDANDSEDSTERPAEGSRKGAVYHVCNPPDTIK